MTSLRRTLILRAKACNDPCGKSAASPGRQGVRRVIADNPRPINHVKIDGGGGQSSPSWADRTDDASQPRWRIGCSGCAVGRFHRPQRIESAKSGFLAHCVALGLSPLAETQICSRRMVTEEMEFSRCQLPHDLLSNRQDGEAFGVAEPGACDRVYFPWHGEVSLNLSGADDEFSVRVRWLDNPGLLKFQIQR